MGPGGVFFVRLVFAQALWDGPFASLLAVIGGFRLQQVKPEKLLSAHL